MVTVSGRTFERKAPLQLLAWIGYRYGFVEYLHYIEGRLTPDKATGGPRIWTKQDGSSGSSFEVTAGTVRFLSSRGEGGEAPMMGSMEGAEIPAEDDIPF